MHTLIADERQRARHIVETYGRSPNAFLALLDDKSYYFSAGGSLIAYMVYRKVAVAPGDPIGPPEDTGHAIAGFQSLCRQNKWIPAFCPASPVCLDHYQQAGLRHFLIGYYGSVDLHTFTLQGNARANYRKRYQRLIKQGFRMLVHPPPLPDYLLVKMRCISDQWLKRVSGAEKRFFNGWFDPEIMRRSPIAIIYNPAGEPVAFANLVSEFQLNEISFDLMRYAQDVPAGITDFFFVSLFFWAKEQGYDSINLGGSELAQVGQDPGAPFMERLIHFLYQYTNLFRHYKGLHGFKRKFQPVWEARYLIYPGALQLPLVCYAIASIDINPDF